MFAVACLFNSNNGMKLVATLFVRREFILRFVVGWKKEKKERMNEKRRSTCQLCIESTLLSLEEEVSRDHFSWDFATGGKN